MWVLPLGAMLVSAFFGGAVLRQYSQRRNPAHLVWSIALFIFALATACDFIASISGWTVFIAKLYYLTGGTVVVGYLAAGTLYLLAPKAVGHVWLVIMTAVTIIAAEMLAMAATNHTTLAAAVDPGWKAIDIPPMLTGLAVSVNSLGTLILVVGAVYSAVYRRYPAANLMIAAGTLIVAAGGSLTRLGRYELQSIGQAAGITVIFLGFMMTAKAPRNNSETGPL